ncbi:MAG: hypothetical protein AAFO79_11355, partial [Pseudomonadota bacterium]
MRTTFRCPHFKKQSGLPDGPRLVGFGFRCWVTGLLLRDPTHWERAWNVYRGVFDAGIARQNFRALEMWARTIDTHACR